MKSTDQKITVDEIHGSEITVDKIHGSKMPWMKSMGQNEKLNPRLGISGNW
jgi:hypothetical protein